MSHSLVSKPRRHLWCGLAILAIALPAGAGELYQWKDAKGVTHYADAPPVGQVYKSRILNNAGYGGQATAPKTAESAQCMTARMNLEHLTGSQPIGFDADGDGKPDAVFDAAQRAEQTRLAGKAVERRCAASAIAAEADG